MKNLTVKVQLLNSNKSDATFDSFSYSFGFEDNINTVNEVVAEIKKELEIPVLEGSVSKFTVNGVEVEGTETLSFKMRDSYAFTWYKTFVAETEQAKKATESAYQPKFIIEKSGKVVKL